jgi:nucleoside triphosphate pyrophosphatase
VPNVKETEGGDPERLVVENARRKAEAGIRDAPEGAIALGVDTEVALDGRTFGKAADADQARAHLEALSGRAHEVLSGVVLLGPRGPAGDPAERSGVAGSRVTFRELDPPTLDLYIDSGEWRDRAGAYAVQGLGSILIERLEGDFSNVVGLPVGLLIELAPELLERSGRGV